MRIEKTTKECISIVMTLALIITSLGVCGNKAFATAADKTTEATSASSQTDSSEQSSEESSETPASTDISRTTIEQNLIEYNQKKQHAQEILDGLKSAKDDLEYAIIDLDKTLAELEIETNHLEANRKELAESIEATTKKLEEAKAAQVQQYEQMKLRIQMVYESGNKNYLDVLLTATSMMDMLNKTEYVSQVSFYDYSMLKEISDAKEQVANLKMKLDMDMKTNEELMAQVDQQKKDTAELVELKSAQVREYESSIKGQEEEVNKYTMAVAAAEAAIAAAENNTNYTVNNPYTGGSLVWPVPGHYEISSPFGSRSSPTAGASSYHKGIDIRCSVGDSVVAAAPGVVIVAEYNYAEGNYVLIDHGGGMSTVYMHNSQLLVSVGQTVTAGQTIALAGSTGVSTGPHCHFGVRINGQYVDPQSIGFK